jgi:hypothetical protein
MPRKYEPMPTDCALIQARLIQPGDRVRFRMSSADYTVQDVDTDCIGNVRHRFGDGTASASYCPGELLWITRRNGNGHENCTGEG